MEWLLRQHRHHRRSVRHWCAYSLPGARANSGASCWERAVSQQITFEPRHRNALGSAGRIDVYSYPEMREAMLLRVPNTNGAQELTQEATEKRVAETPWTAFSQERMPLRADLSNDEGVRAFLEDLVATR